jgi:glycosidase
MGFTAIWITPITEQLSQDTGDGEAYHGYWQQEMLVALLSLNHDHTDQVS